MSLIITLQFVEVAEVEESITCEIDSQQHVSDSSMEKSDELNLGMNYKIY